MVLLVLPRQAVLLRGLRVQAAVFVQVLGRPALRRLARQAVLPRQLAPAAFLQRAHDGNAPGPVASLQEQEAVALLRLPPWLSWWLLPVLPVLPTKQQLLLSVQPFQGLVSFCLDVQSQAQPRDRR